MSSVLIFCPVKGYGHIFRYLSSVSGSPDLAHAHVGELGVCDIFSVSCCDGIVARYVLLSSVNILYSVPVVLRQILVNVCPLASVFAPLRFGSRDGFFLSGRSRLSVQCQGYAVRANIFAVVYPGLDSGKPGGARQGVGQVIAVLR